MREIEFGGETIKVLEATGYDDGYYWDMNAKIEFGGETYSIVDAGSVSGYVPHVEIIIKDSSIKRLYGEEQGEIDEDEWDYFESAICRILSSFIESGAKISWECQEEDDSWDTYVLVDGLRIVEREEDEEES